MRNEEPNPELDANDITITTLSLNVYRYSENDWDAEVSIDIRNEGRRGYVVDMPVYIVDEEGNQLDDEKTFEFRVGPNGWFEGSKKWNATNSKVRGGEEVVAKKVEVQSRKFLKSGHTDVVRDTEKVIEDEE